MITKYQDPMAHSSPFSDLIAGGVYEIPGQPSQSEPIQEYRGTSYPPPEAWEQGFGG